MSLGATSTAVDARGEVPEVTEPRRFTRGSWVRTHTRGAPCTACQVRSSGSSNAGMALVWYICHMNTTIQRLACSCSDTCSNSKSESDDTSFEELELELESDSESLLSMALQPKLCSSLVEQLVHLGAAAPSGPPAASGEQSSWKH